MVIMKTTNMTEKEIALINSNPAAKYLIEKFDMETRIQDNHVLNSRISARVQNMLNEIINPFDEHKLRLK